MVKFVKEYVYVYVYVYVHRCDFLSNFIQKLKFEKPSNLCATLNYNLNSRPKIPVFLGALAPDHRLEKFRE